MSRKPPPRGARAGVKADLAAQKEGQAGFEADKKPWHPLNFRNQMKRFEAEEKLIRNQKLEEANKAEFEAEQQYLETLAYLPGKEADKFRDMQGVSWMYIKPPGMKSLEEQEREKQKKEQQSAAAAGNHGAGSTSRSDANASSMGGKPLTEAGEGPPDRPPREQEKQRGIGSAIGHTIKFQRRPKSPPIGGLPQGANYDFVVSEDELEVDKRLLEALKAAAGSDDDRSDDDTSKGNASKRHRSPQTTKGHPSRGTTYRGTSTSPRSSQWKRRKSDYDEHGTRGGDAGASRSRARVDDRHRGGRTDVSHTRHHDRGHLSEEHHNSSHEQLHKRGRYDMQGHTREEMYHDKDYYSDRKRHHSRGERRGQHGRSSRSHRTDHERRDESRLGEDMHGEHAHDDFGRRSESLSDRERDRHRKSNYKSSKSSSREKNRSNKERKRKRCTRETKDDATLEDAVRFIVDQGLSAEDVLNELRSRKKM